MIIKNIILNQLADFMHDVKIMISSIDSTRILIYEGKETQRLV
jgi:hypothetical protein